MAHDTETAQGTTSSAVELARDLYRALATGDTTRLSELLHADFEGRATDGLPLELGGAYAGPQAMRQEFWGRIGRNFRAHAEPEEFHTLDDGQLLVLGRYVGEARATGGKLDAAFAHVLRFADGRIVRLIQLTDSQRWWQALAGGATDTQTDTRTSGTPTADTGPTRADAAGDRRQEEPVVAFELADGLAHIRLNRPEARNAIDEALVAGLYEAAVRCSDEPGLRAVLLTGSGDAFTVGGDITLFSRTDPAELPRLLRRMTGPYHEALRRLARLDAPIVCAVHGAVAGGGLGLAHCADLVLAAEDTKFALGFGAIGLSGDGGNSWFLPRMVGPRRAAQLYLEQRVLTAREAEEWGIVSRVVSADSLHTEALAVARRLADGPTRAYAEMRHLLRSSWDSSLAEQFAAEERALGRTAATTDAAEGIASFAAKRTPTFRGR